MPNRIVKESIWTSPNFNRLSCIAERHFFRLLPLPDDTGVFEATPSVIKGKCYPLKKNIKNEHIKKWNKELEEAGIIEMWHGGDGREYGRFVNWEKHQRIRSVKKPRYPEALSLLDDNCRQLTSDDDNCSQMTTDHIYNIYNNNNNNIRTNIYDHQFEKLWKAYPRKVGKLKAYRVYKTRIREGYPYEVLMKATVNYAKSVEGSDLKYVKHPSTFWGPDKPFLDHLEEPSRKCGNCKYGPPDAETQRYCKIKWGTVEYNDEACKKFEDR